MSALNIDQQVSLASAVCQYLKAADRYEQATEEFNQACSGIRSLNLREVHERPEGFEEAAVIFVGMSIDRVMQGLGILEIQPRGTERSLRLVTDYAPNNVSDKVLRIIQSYTDFVNRKVWHKS